VRILEIAQYEYRLQRREVEAAHQAETSKLRTIQVAVVVVVPSATMEPIRTVQLYLLVD
jgi:hypothetical protein